MKHGVGRGFFLSSGVGKHDFVNGIMNPKVYKDILDANLLKSVTSQEFKHQPFF